MLTGDTNRHSGLLGPRETLPSPFCMSTSYQFYFPPFHSIPDVYHGPGAIFSCDGRIRTSEVITSYPMKGVFNHSTTSQSGFGFSLRAIDCFLKKGLNFCFLSQPASSRNDITKNIFSKFPPPETCHPRAKYYSFVSGFIPFIFYAGWIPSTLHYLCACLYFEKTPLGAQAKRGKDKTITKCNTKLQKFKTYTKIKSPVTVYRRGFHKVSLERQMN
jgi:hypothetical protein